LGKESADEMLAALLTSRAAAGLPAAANRERSLAGVHVGERVRAQDGIEALKRLITALNTKCAQFAAMHTSFSEHVACILVIADSGESRMT
jgi:hypothetical protein